MARTSLTKIMADDATPNVPVVMVKGGTILADSRDIAKAFGKQHKDVLRKIDQLIAEAPDLCGRNFTPTSTDVMGPRGGFRVERGFEMNRKGFSLLAMRFTGYRALQWQIAYVDEFDRMERALLEGDHGGLTAQDRGAIGGIVKGVVAKALADLLPAMVEHELTSHRYAVVEGVSALEAAEIVGYPAGRRPRGLTQFISRRLTRLHEDRGIPVRRSRHGAGKVKLYDEVATRSWIAGGGKAETDRYIQERRGQGRFKLIG